MTFKTSDGTIYSLENSAFAIQGTFTVTDSLNINNKTVTVKYDSDGVSVNVNDGLAQSITGLSDGGIVEYDGKIYQRVGNYIFEGGKAYTCDDATNILELSGGELYTEIANNTIDLTNISGDMIFGVNGEKVAEYKDGVLTIDSGSYTVKTSGSVTIGDTIYNSDGAL